MAENTEHKQQRIFEGEDDGEESEPVFTHPCRAERRVKQKIQDSGERVSGVKDVPASEPQIDPTEDASGSLAGQSSGSMAGVNKTGSESIKASGVSSKQDEDGVRRPPCVSSRLIDSLAAAGEHGTGAQEGQLSAHDEAIAESIYQSIREKIQVQVDAQLQPLKQEKERLVAEINAETQRKSEAHRARMLVMKAETNALQRLVFRQGLFPCCTASEFDEILEEEAIRTNKRVSVLYREWLTRFKKNQDGATTYFMIREMGRQRFIAPS